MNTTVQIHHVTINKFDATIDIVHDIRNTMTGRVAVELSDANVGDTVCVYSHNYLRVYPMQVAEIINPTTVYVAFPTN